MAVFLAWASQVTRLVETGVSDGGLRLSCDALREEECDDEHGGCGVEGSAGDVDAGADGYAEDVGEEIGPTRPAIPRRLLIAPWSWPCSEGLVLRERRLWAAGQVKDIMFRKGNAHPEEDAGF